MAGSHETNPVTKKSTSSKKSKSKTGKSGINILENLGKAMNIMKNDMNIKNRLGNHKGRMNKSRSSLELLGERQNSLRLLCMN